MENMLAGKSGGVIRAGKRTKIPKHQGTASSKELGKYLRRAECPRPPHPLTNFETQRYYHNES